MSGALDDGWRPTVPTGGAQGDVLTMSGCFPVAGLRCLSRVSGSLQGSLRMRPQLPCSHQGEGGALSSPFEACPHLYCASTNPWKLPSQGWGPDALHPQLQGSWATETHRQMLVRPESDSRDEVKGTILLGRQIAGSNPIWEVRSLAFCLQDVPGHKHHRNIGKGARKKPEGGVVLSQRTGVGG